MWRDGAPDGCKTAFSELHLLMMISVTLPQEQWKTQNVLFLTIIWGTASRVGAVFSPLMREAAGLPGETRAKVTAPWWNWYHVTELSQQSCSHVNDGRRLAHEKYQSHSEMMEEMGDSGNIVSVEVVVVVFYLRDRRIWTWIYMYAIKGQQSQDCDEL